MPDTSRKNLRQETADALTNSDRLCIAGVAGSTYTHAQIDESRAAITRSRAQLARPEERGSVELRLTKLSRKERARRAP